MQSDIGNERQAKAVLEKYEIHSASLRGVYYLPAFLNDDEEAALLKQIYAAPVVKWTNLKNRRLQNWGGIPHPKGMLATPLPDWLVTWAARLHRETGVFSQPPNHVLINEYLPGQGIMAHEDGPLYEPATAVLNLGGGCALEFFPVNPSIASSSTSDSPASHSPAPRCGTECMLTLYVDGRSMYVFSGPAYTECMHGIPARLSDMVEGVEVPRSSTRVSLTFRVVKKVLKAKLKL